MNGPDPSSFVVPQLSSIPFAIPPAADALPDLNVLPPGPASQAWLRRCKAAESANVTAVAADFPVVWASARGAAVRDVDGNTYIDATSAFGVALIGHSHPEVLEAISQQASSLVHGMGDVHPPAVRIALLEALQAVAPGDLGHAVLCSGGAEAVEVALKTALLATAKPGVIAFSGSYHGLGHGALDVTSRRDFRAPFASQLARNTQWVPYPDPRQPPVGVAVDQVLAHVLQRVEDIIAHPAQGGVPIGAVLCEPIQGRGGSLLPPPGFLPALRALCDRHGVLLILDEIFTGFGRTGRLFACEHVGVLPDLLCVGKALGGGMPISACLGRPSVMAAWHESTGEALHTSTFLGHPLACAAALATLRVILRDRIADQAAIQGLAWQAQLREALTSPWVEDIRGQGLMLGVELRNPHNGQPAPEVAWATVVAALRRGVLLLPCGVFGHVIQLTPPAVMTPAQRTCVIAALVAGLEQAVARQG